MRVDTPFVHAAPGDSAQLECIVQGNPEPTVRSHSFTDITGLG